ncbi:hypothetical protein GH714_023727 [Hevea brasiliensis]|uniref:Uncharacterized protein n=1 Tax=Hevea brasiliensis TaxID=3981 RepID=A0A6A6MQG2_HEVBR|nr:hypothetical protein GH714_023727 [Hevea brasiliensis]
MDELMGLGVNRVSLGVQAFQGELLKACGRAHGVKEVYEAIGIMGSCGIENWSMDLISSLPHQTPQMWEESLRLTVQAQPKHVSVYDLQVEQGTKFGILYTPGEFPLPSETQSADFYRMASQMLSDAGYSHYEISSYCKDGPRKMREYMGYVKNMNNGAVDCCGNNHLDAKDLAMDVLMLSLRTARGLDIRSFTGVFGGSVVYSLCKVYKPYIETGHVVCLDEERRAMTADEFNNLFTHEDEISSRLAYIRLSDPDGFLLSNELISLAFGVMAP